MAKKIFFPFELFKELPVKESDKLQEKMMVIYYKDNTDKLNEIIGRANGDSDLVEMYKEDEFQKAINKDYGFSRDILEKRKDDDLAEALVESIDDYNARVEKETQGQPEQEAGQE